MPTERRRDAGPASVASQTGVALAALTEAWLRDTVFTALGLLSLVGAVCGFGAADGAGYAVLGLVAAVLAVAIATVAIVRKARAPQVWLAVLAGVAIDAAALAVILTS